jgi:hypothetical protein
MPARLCFTGWLTCVGPSLAGWPMVLNPTGWPMPARLYYNGWPILAGPSSAGWPMPARLCFTS